MEDKHTLLIHMGMPKTGTSSLQEFLYKNSGVLESYGWCYPSITLPSNDLTKLINGYALVHPDDSYLLTPFPELQIDTLNPNYRHAWDCIHAALVSYDVIISYENIFKMDLVYFLSEMRRQYDKIKVIVYLRRQDYYLEASWNQCIKDGNFNVDIERFKEGGEIIDYWKQLEAICKMIGQENMIVRVYEKGELLHDDVVDDFLQAIGITMDISKCDCKKSLNERLDQIVIKEKFLFNTVCSKEICRKYNREIMGFFRKVNDTAKAKGYYRKKCGYLKPEWRREILSRCADSNEKVAKKYFDREKLFLDQNTDIPYYEIKSTETERILAEIFAPALCEMIQENHYMRGVIKTQRNMLATYFMNQIEQDGRELILFGAGANCRIILEEYDLRAAFIVDNDRKKEGSMVGDLKVVSPEQIQNWKHYFVLITCAKTDEIENQLKSYGMVADNDFIFAKDVFFLLLIE